ncbi:MAG: hypothetical protein PUI85_04495 [Eubacteriales bacterium]|nr:hypothetical protein [Eubacteriales bacterium]MDY3332408.1 hypothetical protein [Gallibacter sp.]
MATEDTNTEYNVKVNGGTSDKPRYKKDERVNLTANVPAGYIFDRWELNSGEGVVINNPENKETFFNMKTMPVEVTAHIKAVPYTVTIEDGEATVDGRKIETAKVGELVTIKAVDKKGQEFTGWKVIEGNFELKSPQEKVLHLLCLLKQLESRQIM